MTPCVYDFFCDILDKVFLGQEDWKHCPGCGSKIEAHNGYDPTLPSKREMAPYWGFLEGIEINFVSPIPNMNASRKLNFDFIRFGRMADPDINVFSRVRNVG